MKDKRFVFGVVLTAMWLGVMVAFMCLMPLPDGLNEWGDFFAGFFSPVAFLWLVVGYLQQGEELRNSNAALKLQADELKASVQQQIEMVRISAKQLEHDREVFKAEQLEKKLSVMPRLSFRALYYHANKETPPNQIHVSNYGCAVKSFEFRTFTGGRELWQDRVTFFNPGEDRVLAEMRAGESIDAEFIYFDGDGFQHCEYYEITCVADGEVVATRVSAKDKAVVDASREN